MKLEINPQENLGKTRNTWKLKNIKLRINGLTKKLKRKLKGSWKPMKIISLQPQTSGVQKRQHKREVYSNSGLPKEGSKVSDTQLKLTPKELEEEQQIKHKNIRRWEIIKIREVNAIKTKKPKPKQNKQNKTNKQKKQQGRSMKPGAGSLKELTKLISPQPV